jgi:hypothetical protein
MNSIISFRGQPISTSSRGRANPLGMTGPEALHGKNVSRRYDCESYLDCLFRASVVNASRLPCKGCSSYSPKYAEEDRKDTRLWT